MTLLLFAACAPKAAPSPDESATDSVIDSGGETARDETDAQDSASDSTPETGDTGPTDTGVVPADWSPGEDIPGWEDTDCTEPLGSEVLETQFPTMAGIVGTFGSFADGTGPHWIDVLLRDCVYFSCADGTSYREEAFALVALDATAAAHQGAELGSRGTGAWGPDEGTGRAVQAEGAGPLETWSNGRFDLGDPAYGSADVCLSRVRPDELEGVLRVEIQIAWSNATEHTLFDFMVLRFPFRFTFADHAGFDPNLPDLPGEEPDGFDDAHFVYEAGYDAAWPWDEITDPGIREAVYRRYLPYNAG